MSDQVQATIARISSKISDRSTREKISRDLKQLDETFLEINKKLNTLLPDARFLMSVSEKDSSFKESFEVVLDAYQSMRKVLILSWGEDLKDIDIIDTGDLQEGLSELSEKLENLDICRREFLRSLMEELKGDKKRALTLHSLIPEISLDVKVFDEALEFFEKNASTPDKLHIYVMGKENTKAKIAVWKQHLTLVNNEHKRLDLKNIAGITLPTQEFLEKIVKTNRFWFKDLSAEILEDINGKFPELSKKLLIKVFQND